MRSRRQKGERRYISHDPEDHYQGGRSDSGGLRDADRLEVQAREYDPQIFVRKDEQARNAEYREQDVVAGGLCEVPVNERSDSSARAASRAKKSGISIKLAFHSISAAILIDAQQGDQDRNRDSDHNPFPINFIHLMHLVTAIYAKCIIIIL